MSSIINRTVGGIEYQLYFKKVKNLNLRIRQDGSVWVSAPKRVPIAEIERFVASRASWIAKTRERVRSWEENQCDRHSEQECLAFFAEISERIYPLFAEIIGEKPELRVRWFKSRWGVCYPAKRRIALNGRLFDQPLAAVEYVVLHEYMHFLYPNHQKDFHAAMAAVMPDYRKRRRLLH